MQKDILLEQSLELEEYKKIPISLQLDNEAFFGLQKLFSYYPPSEIFFKIENGNLTLYLKQLDLSDFKRKIWYVKKISPQKREIFDIILNEIEKIKSYGLKGRKRIFVGYDKERKVKERKKKELVRGVYYYARDHNFSRKNNPLPEEFQNKIIVGDSEEVLKKLPENCIDLIFTSPPYNFGLEYESHKDGINWNEYFKKLLSFSVNV